MEPVGKNCVIISGGVFSTIGTITQEDYVIVCDKGYDYARIAGVEPNLIIGDFDSCSETTRQQLESIDVSAKVERYPSEKDDTDTMLAIKRALELGCQRIRIYCGLGGRLDHFYANLQALVYAAKRGVLCTVEDDDNCIYAMGKGSLTLPKRDGWSISLFAATDVCQGITTRGLKYALEYGELVNSFPLGMSNEWAEEMATIELSEGILLVILSKKEG